MNNDPGFEGDYYGAIAAEDNGNYSYAFKLFNELITQYGSRVDLRTLMDWKWHLNYCHSKMYPND